MAFTLFQSNTKAKSAEVNDNFAYLAADRLVGFVSSTGIAKSEFDIGDLTEITNGSLVNDILVREGGALNIYNASGTLLQSTSLLDLTSPAGAVVAFAMNTEPTGWLECDGSAISRSTYSVLFAAIGTTWGVGNGTTTFNIPDIRGVFVRGWDNGRGIDSGRSFGSNQTDALQNITGNFGGINATGANASGAFALSNTFSGAGQNTQTNYNMSFDASRVARTASETRPYNAALMYCIKY